MPTGLNIAVDIEPAVEGLHELQRRSVPYAKARTLTMVAKDGQEAARGQIKDGRFKLRNTWTVRQTLYHSASKQGSKRFSQVFTDTQNRKTGAPDYMGRQETGGEKVPLGGRQYIAIPTRYLRKYAPRIIPDQLRATHLLPNGAMSGGMPWAAPRRRNISKRAYKKLGGGWVAFVQKARTGSLFIFVRKAGQRDAEPWYLLVREAEVPKRLDMTEIVQKTVIQRFPIRWAETWRGIMAKGLRIKM